MERVRTLAESLGMGTHDGLERDALGRRELAVHARRVAHLLEHRHLRHELGVELAVVQRGADRLLLLEVSARELA